MVMSLNHFVDLPITLHRSVTEEIGLVKRQRSIRNAVTGRIEWRMLCLNHGDNAKSIRDAEAGGQVLQRWSIAHEFGWVVF